MVSIVRATLAPMDRTAFSSPPLNNAGIIKPIPNHPIPIFIPPELLSEGFIASVSVEGRPFQRADELVWVVAVAPSLMDAPMIESRPRKSVPPKNCSNPLKRIDQPEKAGVGDPWAGDDDDVGEWHGHFGRR